jgi:crossover junction endodeoxyribonuclease RusA
VTQPRKDDRASAPLGARFDLPLIDNKPPLNQNQRLHWAEKNRRAQLVRNTVAWKAKQLKLGQHQHLAAQLHYQPGDNRRRDAPNLTATSKPAIDGLVDAGIVPDDNDQHVTEHMPLIHRGPGERALWLEIVITSRRPEAE